jgi:purine-binding chemotaxis protein CheW
MMDAERGQRDDRVTDVVEVCCVRVCERVFGIPIRRVLEIVGGVRPQRVPLAPCFVGGLVHYRGDVLTTVSVRQLLGMPASEGAQDVLVVDSAGGTYGVLVDGVIEVMTLSSVDLEANPCTLHESRQGLFAGAYKLQDGLMVMLDPETLEPMRLARTAGAQA